MSSRPDDPPPIGAGPHSLPWPTDPRLDPALLATGDTRNVIDDYRYWTVEAIRADLDERRHNFHVAIENWEHDFNIGTIVRNANAFMAKAVHIVGKRKWNRRGAMVTDRYQHVMYHPSIEDLVGYCDTEALRIVGIDNVDGSIPIESVRLPSASMMVFGQEGPGLSPPARRAAELICSITQFGSTRSINAGVASGIAMHRWIVDNVWGHAPSSVESSSP